MSVHINSDYYRDVIEKRYCGRCLKQFAVGEELAKTVPAIMCPYCGSADTHASVLDDEDRGCAGICFYKDGSEYYDRCCLCHTVIAPGDAADVHLCTGCAP